MLCVCVCVCGGGGGGGYCQSVHRLFGISVGTLSANGADSRNFCS